MGRWKCCVCMRHCSGSASIAGSSINREPCLWVLPWHPLRSRHRGCDQEKGWQRNFPALSWLVTLPGAVGSQDALDLPSYLNRAWFLCIQPAEADAKTCLHSPPPHIPPPPSTAATPGHCSTEQGLSPAPGRWLVCLASLLVLSCAGYFLAPDTPADPSVLDSQHIRLVYHRRNHLNYFSFCFLWDSSREETLKRILDLRGSLMNH